MQWQKVQLENGLKQLAFPLSSEPIQGSYKVVVQKESGGKTDHSFTVEEFCMHNGKSRYIFFILKVLEPGVWASLAAFHLLYVRLGFE